MKKLFILLVFVSLSVYAQDRSYFEVTPFLTNVLETEYTSAPPVDFGFRAAFNWAVSRDFALIPFYQYQKVPTGLDLSGLILTSGYVQGGVSVRVYVGE